MKRLLFLASGACTFDIDFCYNFLLFTCVCCVALLRTARMYRHCYTILQFLMRDTSFSVFCPTLPFNFIVSTSTRILINNQTTVLMLGTNSIRTGVLLKKGINDRLTHIIKSITNKCECSEMRFLWRNSIYLTPHTHVGVCS